jgi:hypothetical protein
MIGRRFRTYSWGGGTYTLNGLQCRCFMRPADTALIDNVYAWRYKKSYDFSYRTILSYRYLQVPDRSYDPWVNQKPDAFDPGGFALRAGAVYSGDNTITYSRSLISRDTLAHMI